MVKFGPLGTIVLDAVFESIASFLSKDELYQFGLLSPRANRFIKNFKKRFSNFRSIGDFSMKDCLVDDNILNSIIKINISEILFDGALLNISMSLLLKMLHRYRNNVTLDGVQLPGKLVNNNTLKLMDYIDIYCLPNSNPYADVTDVFLLERTTQFKLHGFKTASTIKGILDWHQKSASVAEQSFFGVLSSDFSEEAIAHSRRNLNGTFAEVTLSSINGRKTLDLPVTGNFINLTPGSYSINLDIEDSSDMVPIPTNFIEQETQESFQKFNKILMDPHAPFHSDEFHIMNLSFTKGGSTAKYLIIEYPMRNAFKKVRLERTDISDDKITNVVVGILRNCVFIDNLKFNNVILNENLYKSLKSIGEDIIVKNPWSIDISLNPESFGELLRTEKRLFGMIDIPNSKYLSKEVLPNEVLILYLKKKFQIDTSRLSLEISSSGSETWLTDQFLFLISLKVDRIPKNFCFKAYPTTYSAEGMKCFIEVVFSKSTHIYLSWHLGIIDPKEIYMEDVIGQFKVDSKFHKVARSSVSENGHAYTAVAVMKSTFGNSFTIEFDLLEATQK